MTTETKKVSNEITDEGIGSLGGCFVEGNAEQKLRERKLRRRSLTISILLQAAILAAVIFIPLFGKTERIALAYTPIPPYYHHGSPRPVAPSQTLTGPDSKKMPCFFCPVTPISGHPTIEGSGPVATSEPIGPGDSIPCTDCISLQTPVSQPQIPNQEIAQTGPRTLKIGHLDPAMLMHRVEPIYPVLPRQMRREGRVELHAIIAIDGTIQSLQAVGGDPMFYTSALEAVRQWEYKPTIMNGQPIQIETTITVIYTLNR